METFLDACTEKTKVTAVGFEPTPLRTAALTQRLRPLGHTVDICTRKKMVQPGDRWGTKVSLP